MSNARNLANIISGGFTADDIPNLDASKITTGTITPSDNTVTNAKIVDSTIQLAKLSATGTKDATTFLRGDNTFASVVGGITMVDQWRLTASITSIGTSTVVLSSNWGQMSGDGYGGIGSSMTESSGVFTFPETGIYLIQGLFNFEQSTNDNNDVRLFIQTTTDNGALWSAISRGSANMHSGWLSSTMPHAIFDVTDVTTHKVRFQAYAGNPNMSVLGSSSLFYSGATFIKLGDT